MIFSSKTQIIGTAAFALIVGVLIGRISFSVKSEDNMNYAVYGGEVVKGKEVLLRISNDLEQLEKNKYEIKKKAVEEIITERLFQKNNSPSVPDMNIEITKDEFEAFLKAQNIIAKNLSPQDVLNITNNMKMQKFNENKKSKTLQLFSDAHVQFKIPRSKSRLVQIDNGIAERLGSFMAPVTVVEFANFHCPYCAVSGKRISELREKYKDKVQVHFRFSMKENPESIVFKSALAALCANDQKQFWPYHDALLAIPPLDESVLLSEAVKLKMDAKVFADCMLKERHKGDVLKDIQESRRAGLSSTPSFVINGQVVLGQSPIDDLITVVDGEL